MPDPHTSAGLSGEDLETWAALATVLEWLPPALDAQLQRDAELTHFEYGVLFALANAPDHTLRMSVLAGYANSSLSRLSRATSRLESKGWARRTPDPTDGRYTLAVLTEQGQRKVGEATPGHTRTVRRLVLDRLTRAQARQLREISRRITRAISDEDEWQPPPQAPRPDQTRG
ncbi:MarR family transcriptional regulator [Actinotalea sp. BY-33]|uniref:MarR family transcriptional regulator n=1 Tax=Actinotalea soli TaxID=2819234 RepID=A0A939LT61_9CELL|nr:MarR family transcriptional regulator [Actinotalea soli]MBO1752555.1 MarR family transcriptional regulator [Actinotalea soli]